MDLREILQVPPAGWMQKRAPSLPYEKCAATKDHHQRHYIDLRTVPWEQNDGAILPVRKLIHHSIRDLKKMDYVFTQNSLHHRPGHAQHGHIRSLFGGSWFV